MNEYITHLMYYQHIIELESYPNNDPETESISEEVAVASVFLFQGYLFCSFSKIQDISAKVCEFRCIYLVKRLETLYCLPIDI